MEDLIIKKHPIFTDYAADQYGQIYSLKYNKVITRVQSPHGRGYLHLSLWQDSKKKQYLSHRFIWECHNGIIPDGLQINHIDCDKHNNRLDNLELVDQWMNMEHGKQNGVLYGAANPNHPHFWM